MLVFSQAFFQIFFAYSLLTIVTMITFNLQFDFYNSEVIFASYTKRHETQHFYFIMKKDILVLNSKLFLNALIECSCLNHCRVYFIYCRNHWIVQTFLPYLGIYACIGFCQNKFLKKTNNLKLLEINKQTIIELEDILYLSYFET